LPVEFDYGPITGDPDLLAPSTGADRAAGSYAPSGGTVTPGIWQAVPAELLGPYRRPAPSGFVKMHLTATTKSFDPAVTSATSDFWLYSSEPTLFFYPVTIRPGETNFIYVTITPSGTPGTVVSGKLYVDDYLDDLPPDGRKTGNELAAIPYSYTVGPAPGTGTRIAGAGLSPH
jgi:hypothetical protein